MAEEEHPIRGVSPPPHAPVERSFDDLAKGLVDGTVSRRKALRLMGGALVGAALASVPGAAWAEKCKPLLHKCAFNTQCCSRNCMKNPQGRGRICGCPTDQTLCNNQCIVCNNVGEVVNPETCQCECPTGQVVCNNACVSNVCGVGEVFDPTTCQCEGVTDCTGSAQFCDVAFPCGPDNNCLCFNTTEGGHLCTAPEGFFCGELFCDSTSDCPEGYFCARTCCADFLGSDTCLPRCGTTPLQTQVPSSGGPSAVLPS
jgi:hypothetical protein